MNEWENKLYYGDNLDIMRDHIADESVALIYLIRSRSLMAFDIFNRT